MALAYIGLGGNVGDVIASMAGALQELDANPFVDVVDVSSVYRTPPWGLEDQDWFHNACASLDARMEPIELLEECLKIEKLFKREREVRWGPRTLDLDLLMFGEETLSTDRLTLPHPRMQERSFVIKPLEDIAPDVPVFGKTPGEWLVGLEDRNDMRKVELATDWWRNNRR